MLKRMVLIVLGLTFTLTAVGCESMGMMKKDSAAMSDKGLIAISNHGSVVFVPTGNGDVQMLSTTGDTSCAQCKADAADYFKTGKLTEKCSVCGATRYPLMRGK
jgi:hypothetical protein